MKWNEMNCTVSNFKWNEMKWNVTNISTGEVKWSSWKCIFFMKFQWISLDKKGAPNELTSLSKILHFQFFLLFPKKSQFSKLSCLPNVNCRIPWAAANGQGTRWRAFWGCFLPSYFLSLFAFPDEPCFAALLWYLCCPVLIREWTRRRLRSTRIRGIKCSPSSTRMATDIFHSPKSTRQVLSTEFRDARSVFVRLSLAKLDEAREWYNNVMRYSRDSLNIHD